MYRQFFGLKYAPLGKQCPLFDNGQVQELKKQFDWLKQSPGLGLLTAEPGLGKTATLRQITNELNPNQYKIFYIAETDFGRLDFYRQLAVRFDLSPSYYRSQLWRDLKQCIAHLVTQKNIQPILIIDEAQNLPLDFFKDFPSFLNFVFDSKDYLTVWLVGHPELSRLVSRQQFAAFASRIQARYELKPFIDKEVFQQLITHGFTQAGCTHSLMSETGIELLRMASQGNPRIASQTLVAALNIATDKNVNHLPDDIIKEALILLKQDLKSGN